MSETFVELFVAVFLLGVVSQLLARRFEIPSVLFLILSGLVIGEAGAGYITLETFGSGLSVIVGVSVAIIVFDGAFQLRMERLREAPSTTLRLVTVGALVTFLGIAGAVRLFLDAPWSISFLVGALLVATGPTVITPILEVVRVREHVASALEAEGIVNDVTAAIAAVVIYQTFVIGDGGPVEGVLTFFEHFGIGIASGLVTAGIIYVVLDRDLAPGDAPQAARFLFLSAALGSFALAELFAPEAGVAAAATAGIALGNADVPHRETMEEFGRDLTLIVLAFVFISLAALFETEVIRSLGTGGLAVALVVVVLIRPVVALLATVGVDRFTWQERMFVGAVGPRGIIPASVATLFAIELADAGNPELGQVLVGTVFLVIFVTVILEAGLARQIADILSVSPMRTIIVGGGRVGRALARRLEERGEFVVFVDNDEGQLEKIRDAGFTARAGDGTEAADLRSAGIDDAKRVVAATGDDNDNLLICQLARSKFDVESVLARVNQPDNVDAFESLDVRVVDAPTATATALDNEIERPAIAHWMNEIGDAHDVQEIEVTAEDLVGRTIQEVNAEIPDGVIVAVIGRNGETHVPTADEEFRHGDSVTFIGDEGGVDRAVRRFHPHE